MNKRFLLAIGFFFLISSCVYAQNTDKKLAFYYYNKEEYEKAIPYFERIYPENQENIVFKKYLSCLRSLKLEKKALDLIKEQVKSFPHTVEYQIELGQEYERQKKDKKAEKIYQNLIEEVLPRARTIIDLQRAFIAIGKNKLALQTLQKGRREIRGYPLNIQFARVYGALNQPTNMMREYIDLLDYSSAYLSSLKQIIPRMIDFEKEDSKRFQIFRKELIQKIQKNPDKQVYSRLLIWSLIQRRNFSAALIQSQALDRRTSNNGKAVYSLGNIAIKNKNYKAAREAFQYILSLGKGQPFYYAAEEKLLNTRFKEITLRRNYSKAEIQKTIQEYKTALGKRPKNGKVLPLVRELAYIQAYFGNQSDSAIYALRTALDYPRYNALETAKTKVLLADILVLKNKIWDASLLYMQVEDNFKYEPVGEEAQFKNARIFYYTGDFKYAQAQLDVLKDATTKLIANNAMNLSIFITENLGLDSNYVAMNLFAKADLLLEQHRFSEAFQLYDSILQKYPTHKLKDDVLMKKAKAFQWQGEWNKAIDKLENIVANFSEEVLADDALYQIAQIYDKHLNQPEKASQYYFKLMKNYPGSLFVTSARKAYREIN